MAIKDEVIISALLSNPTNKSAAKACGISESLLYKRLNESEFNSKYTAARLELFDRNTAAIQGQISAAIGTISGIMNNSDNPAQIRLNAAESILRNSFKLTEQCDILKRIEELERVYNEEY